MYVSMSRLRVRPDVVPDLIAAFRSRAHLVDEVDGFIDLEVWHDQREATSLIMVSRWRDRDAFKSYMRSDRHAASHARIPADLRAAIRLDGLDHLTGYDVVAE